MLWRFSVRAWNGRDKSRKGETPQIIFGQISTKGQRMKKLVAFLLVCLLAGGGLWIGARRSRAAAFPSARPGSFLEPGKRYRLPGGAEFEILENLEEGWFRVRGKYEANSERLTF